MSWLDESWGEFALDALRETLKVDARLRRDMIQFLYDEGFWDPEKLSWAAAEARFNACLNPNKEVYFKLGEVWALMKRFGRHQLFLAMAEDLGFYPPQLKPTEARRLELMERLTAALESSEREVAAARAGLARLDDNLPGYTPTQPSAHKPRPSFSRRAGDTAP